MSFMQFNPRATGAYVYSGSAYLRNTLLAASADRYFIVETVTPHVYVTQTSNRLRTGRRTWEPRKRVFKDSADRRPKGAEQ